MTNLPVWLLDVDGVINVDRTDAWEGSHQEAVVHGFRLRWAPALIDQIRLLHTSKLAEVKWCTTWCGLHSELEQLWQLPKFEPTFIIDSSARIAGEMKLEAARRVLAEQRPLIWTDDMEVPTRRSALGRELHAAGRTLLIRPHWASGLSPADLERITNFCREHTLQPVD